MMSFSALRTSTAWRSMFYVSVLPLFPYIRVACTFSTYSTFSQEVFRFFSLDFVKQRSLAGELVS